MEELFLHLVNMSLSASPLIFLVMLVRWLMKQTPRWIICLLWAVVALRLICPFSFESPIGLMPSQPTISEAQVNSMLPGIILLEQEASHPGITPTPYPEETVPVQITFTEIGAAIWATGVTAMVLYLLASYLRLRHMVQEAIPLCPGVWLCDAVKTPFILGVFFPKIYLPSSIRSRDVQFVIAHERAHLQRGDHCWKPLGFLLLSIFWFHPFIWVAYLLMSKDLELACDEKVIQNLDMEGKKAYSSALLECSTSRRMVFACPVAFGEVAIKDRIGNILNYQRPAFWIVPVSLVVILVGAVCFMATPPVRTEAEAEWAAYPSGVRTEHYAGETFTAQVMLVRNPAQVQMGTPSRKNQQGNASLEGLCSTMAETGAIAGVNGGQYQDNSDSGFAGFTQKHVLVVQKGNADEELVEQLDIRDGINAGPALIVNGEINRDAYDASSGYTARTAIGQREDGSVIFICADGRQSDSLGCTYGDVTDLMVQYGAVNACCLDSGFSMMALYRDAGQIQTMVSFPSNGQELRGQKYWLVLPG